MYIARPGLSTAALSAFLIAAALFAQSSDPRNIKTGRVIPDEGYSDQPYIVKTDDGAWLCVITTGAGNEGVAGQHVVTRRSTDQGRTWSEPVAVEPADGPEASYAVLLKTPYGRVYVFYNHNTDNIRQVIADKPAYKDGFCRRVDSLGHFVFKYSDDGGRSWSARRYDVPVREFAIDRANAYSGKLRFFWNVGRAFSYRGAGYVPIHKVGGFGEGFFTSSEGALLRSANILTERDPARLHWETLPDGDVGLRAPAGGGPVAEEQSFSVLSDGSLFCVYRTIDGYAACSYSRDGGHTWEPPQYMRYADGRPMKHPRAANFAWRCENGKFLYWFHNHGGRFIAESPRRRTMAYDDRNPVWLAGGVEAASPSGRIIRWSQPDIALYDDDPSIRISYPDLVEDGGSYFLTETQKDIARVHELSPHLLEGLWGQFDSAAVPRPGLVLELAGAIPSSAPAPALPPFTGRSAGAGFTLSLWVQFNSLKPDQWLVDNRTPAGRGYALRTTAGRSIEVILNDGRTESRWTSDPGSLVPGQPQHLVAIIDGGPKIISFVIDGRFNDGGSQRQFGWGRFNPHLKSVDGTPELRIGAGLDGRLLNLRLYARPLSTSEAIAAFRAGPSS
jgi:hypothetical protein